MLADSNVIVREALPQTSVSGVIDDLRSEVVDGNTRYLIRLRGDDMYYSLSAKDNDVAVILDLGDAVTIDHAPLPEGSAALILDGYSVTLDRKGR